MSQPSLGVHSESGRLRQVIVCRPGLAHRRLTPENCDELLFDDVFWVKQAIKDHAVFTDLMRAEGIEVLDANDLLAETLDIPAGRAFVLDHRVTLTTVGAGMVEPLRLWMEGLSGVDLARWLIGGLTVGDLPFVPEGLFGAWLGKSGFILPGNRTTPIVVAIVAACGLVIPKTSSRAITSPAGTADMMETLAPVDLDLPAIRRVVEAEGGCVVWGGAVRLSPTDDAFVRIEREIDIDAESQLIASVLSKKVAAGSTHVVIDIPVGPTAKIRTAESAQALAGRLLMVGTALDLDVACLLTDGSQPVGRGIGPAPEARDVLSVLRRDFGAPQDLAERALALAATLLETGGVAAPGTGSDLARAVLADGRAWAKFAAICEAQGGLRDPPEAVQSHEVTPPAAGIVAAIDNRKLARLAKLAGAPGNLAAGLTLAVRVGDTVVKGQPLFRLHAGSAGEIAYALEYATVAPAITIAG